MKRIISLILLIAISGVLFGCGNAHDGNVEKTVISNYMEALKKGDFKTANTYLETVPENFDYGDNEIMRAFFEKLTYEIKTVKVEGNVSKVEIHITLPDTGLIYDQMMSSIGDEVQKLQSAGDETSKAKASDMLVSYLLNQVKSDQVKMAENDIVMELKNNGGEVKIVPTSELSRALSGITKEK